MANDGVRNHASGAAPFVSGQNEFGLLHREAKEAAIPGCLRAGFPPASGLLIDKYRRGQPPLTGSGLAFRFGSERLRRHEDTASSTWPCPGWPRGPPRIGIAGATSPKQVQANAAAAEWRLTEGELPWIDAILAQTVQASSIIRNGAAS